jgi:anthranilate 1,2-dioxygenase large subunit
MSGIRIEHQSPAYDVRCRGMLMCKIRQGITRHPQGIRVSLARLRVQEDGCIGGFVERGIATADNESAIVEMGGASIESEPTRATEASVRGFWSLWRQMTGL